MQNTTSFIPYLIAEVGGGYNCMLFVRLPQLSIPLKTLYVLRTNVSTKLSTD